eukprot:GHVR01106155.1.p1 GENE.GHVR01106155.1~~GHVR01106155.1.p1  ORF type:complete len:243 (+),score=42.65 GHVR01106155.1:67-795(+)
MPSVEVKDCFSELKDRLSTYQQQVNELDKGVDSGQPMYQSVGTLVHLEATIQDLINDLQRTIDKPGTKIYRKPNRGMLEEAVENSESSCESDYQPTPVQDVNKMFPDAPPLPKLALANLPKGDNSPSVSTARGRLQSEKKVDRRTGRAKKTPSADDLHHHLDMIAEDCDDGVEEPMCVRTYADDVQAFVNPSDRKWDFPQLATPRGDMFNCEVRSKCIYVHAYTYSHMHMCNYACVSRILTL